MSIDREINRKFLNLQFFCNRTMINSSEYHKSGFCIVIILTPLTWADMYILISLFNSRTLLQSSRIFESRFVFCKHCEVCLRIVGTGYQIV